MFGGGELWRMCLGEAVGDVGKLKGCLALMKGEGYTLIMY